MSLHAPLQILLRHSLGNSSGQRQFSA